MKRWKLVLKVTLLLCVLLLSACALPPMTPPPVQSTDSNATTDETGISEFINVGLLLPFSGEYGWVGDHILPVVQMVTDEVNESGGIDGAQLRVIQADSTGDADVGATAGKKLLAEDGVVAFLGPTSLSYPGIKPLLEEYHTPMVSPTAGTPELDRAGQEYFFRTVPSDSQGGVVIAEAITNSSMHLDRDPFTNIVLMMTQAPVYTSFQDALNQGMAAGGSQFAATVPIEQAQADYSEALREALTFDPDLIVLISDPADSANILATAAQMGYGGNWFFAQDQTTDEFIALAGADVAAGAFGIVEVPAEESADRAAAFAEQFLAATGQEAQRFATSTYDAANILYLAVLRASLHDGIVNGETVAANIHLVADPGDGKVDVHSFSEGRQALEAGDEINYQGLDGPMDFDEFGNISGAYGIFQVQAGDWVQISTVTADELAGSDELDVSGTMVSTTENTEQQETLFQHSTLDALLAGVYDGQLTIGELKRHGDFGLGTFDALNGEMVVAGGEVYQVDDQGVVHVADDAMTTPFAAVTFFEPDMMATLSESYSCAQLQGYLDALLPETKTPYAIQVHGVFPALTVRSVPAQEPPYAPLAEVLVDQVVFEKQDISGALIGLRLPDYLAGANVAGYHFHFISDDRQVGGHVLDCTTGAVTVTADDIKDIQIDLPQNKAFQEATLPDSDATAADVERLVVLGAFATQVVEPWNQIIHSALLAAEEAGEIHYHYMDDIGLTGDIGSVLRTAIADLSPDIIFGDAFGNYEALQQLAQEYPEIAFVMGSDREAMAPNLSVFDSWFYEPAYLSGMLAGGLTESNILGVVAGFPEGSVNQVVNAFAAGAEAVNPAVEIRTTFIDSWYDLDAAREAALAQIEEGVDVIFAERDGLIETAAERGVYTIGNMMDQQSRAPDYVLTSILWNFSPTVEYVIEQVRNDAYSAQKLVDLSTMSVGAVRLAPINEDIVGGIPADLLARVEARQTEIISGEFQPPTDENQPPASSKVVILGALYDLTGSQAGLDIPSAQGAQLAVDQVNETGGVLGRQVQLVIEDGESDPTVVEEKATEMLTDYPDVAAFMGLSDTDLVLAAAPVAVDSGRLFLTSGATSPKLPAQVPDHLFLAAFGDNVQAAAGAEWAYDDLAARTVSVLYQRDSTYTQLLEGYFRTRFEELGGQVLSIASYTPGEDLGPSIARLQPADFIYLAATPDDLLDVVLALRAAGYDQPILGGDGFDAPDLWSQQPEVSDIFFTTHAYLGEDNDTAKIVAFRQAYAQAYPDAIPDAFAALGYDAARLLLTAIERAGSADPEAVRTALSGIREFDGVTGQLGYLAGSQIPVKSVTILGVEAGEYRLVAERMPDSVPQP